MVSNWPISRTNLKFDLVALNGIENNNTSEQFGHLLILPFIIILGAIIILYSFYF